MKSALCSNSLQWRCQDIADYINHNSHWSCFSTLQGITKGEWASGFRDWQSGLYLNNEWSQIRLTYDGCFYEYGWLDKSLLRTNVILGSKVVLTRVCIGICICIFLAMCNCGGVACSPTFGRFHIICTGFFYVMPFLRIILCTLAVSYDKWDFM